ncbi:MAG: Gfo/Idh/MocA family oxidoreductase [Deltaproteobacteria bacterium]|nr:Gfo/Idh/MocA family oxidoreductase [Deltaproteobacteria bacterium]
MRPLRLAIIGCGNWGEKLARNVAALPHLEFSIACDRDAGRARDVGARHGARRTTADPGDALDPRELDAAVIATPARTHEALVRAALDSGLHVLCEKPLALSAARGAELLERARVGRTCLAVDHTELHSGPFRRLAALVADGAVGALRSVELIHVTRLPGPADVDAVWDLAPHDFAILEALGAGDPAELDATAAGPDSATLAVRYAGGLRAEIRLARGAAERRRSIEVRGTLGVVRAEGFRPGDVVRFRRGNGGGVWKVDGGTDDGAEPLHRLLEDFSNRIRAAPAPAEPVRDGPRIRAGSPPAAHAAELRILRAVETASRAVAARSAGYGAICASSS